MDFIHNRRMIISTFPNIRAVIRMTAGAFQVSAS
jgi:hypothetical protein